MNTHISDSILKTKIKKMYGSFLFSSHHIYNSILQIQVSVVAALDETTMPTLEK